MNVYFDAMGLSMLTGKSFRNLMATLPGFTPQAYDKMIYCGLRDVTDDESKAVEASGAEVVWDGTTRPESFAHELSNRLERRPFSPALAHLDLDVLDESLGKVSGYKSPGGLSEDDLVQCLSIVPHKAKPMSLPVCSFNPNLGDGDKIGKIGVAVVVAFTKSLIEVAIL